MPDIARTFADRIHVAHLRNVERDADGSFYEADYLGGDTDMVAVIDILPAEQAQRKQRGDAHWRIPFRPDYGRCAYAIEVHTREPWYDETANAITGQSQECRMVRSILISKERRSS